MADADEQPGADERIDGLFGRHLGTIPPPCHYRHKDRLRSWWRTIGGKDRGQLQSPEVDGSASDLGLKKSTARHLGGNQWLDAEPMSSNCASLNSGKTRRAPARISTQRPT
ncbi:hypothetical protein [Mesorhizobium sp.]|uniref:hypothetical protein n=1 Tax=Mesorhizobium sp. TaxID=1871066 RepID=UPI00257FC8D1|nr:hypothetical protein [Mesorhizobium sp.]